MCYIFKVGTGTRSHLHRHPPSPHLHKDQDVSSGHVCQAVVGADLVHIVGEDGHHQAAGIVAGQSPRLPATGVVHVHQQL